MRSFAAAFVLVAVAGASNDFVSEMPYPEDWAIIPNKPVLDLNLKFTLAIKEQNLDRVLDIARAVSDPSSATYGQFVTQAQLDELTAPAAQDVAAVTEWLDAQAVNYTVRHSNVFVNTNVLAAEKLFSTNFHIAMRKESNQFVVRAGAYSLPATVNKALTAVFGLHGLPLPPRQRKSPLEGTVEPASVTPAVLATDYGIKGVDVTRSTKNRQAVAEFQGQVRVIVIVKSIRLPRRKTHLTHPSQSSHVPFPRPSDAPMFPFPSS
jgi:subtilase family serine protease